MFHPVSIYVLPAACQPQCWHGVPGETRDELDLIGAEWSPGDQQWPASLGSLEEGHLTLAESQRPSEGEHLQTEMRETGSSDEGETV